MPRDGTVDPRDHSPPPPRRSEGSGVVCAGRGDDTAIIIIIIITIIMTVCHAVQVIAMTALYQRLFVRYRRARDLSDSDFPVVITSPVFILTTPADIEGSTCVSLGLSRRQLLRRQQLVVHCRFKSKSRVYFSLCVNVN